MAPGPELRVLRCSWLWQTDWRGILRPVYVTRSVRHFPDSLHFGSPRPLCPDRNIGENVGPAAWERTAEINPEYRDYYPPPMTLHANQLSCILLPKSHYAVLTCSNNSVTSLNKAVWMCVMCIIWWRGRILRQSVYLLHLTLCSAD